MDVVEIFLLFVVGFSILVFLILDNLDSLEKSRKICPRAEQSKIGSSDLGTAEENDRQKVDAASVGTGCEAEKHENFKRAGFEEEETENPVEESDFCGGFPSVSGNPGDDVGKDDDDGEGEEEFIDDWEGIERTELEKIFGEAVVFVNSSKCNADRIEDFKWQLYGLQKVALEGPCYVSQPMALKVSARSKWNAWQKLGNMSREMAMEQYAEILSQAIPDWKGEGSLTIENAATSEDHLTSANGAEAGR